MILEFFFVSPIMERAVKLMTPTRKEIHPSAIKPTIKNANMSGVLLNNSFLIPIT